MHRGWGSEPELTPLCGLKKKLHDVPPLKSSGVGFLILGSPMGVRLRGVDGVPMGGGWGADEACLRARGGRMRRGFVDALDR